MEDLKGTPAYSRIKKDWNFMIGIKSVGSAGPRLVFSVPTLMILLLCISPLPTRAQALAHAQSEAGDTEQPLTALGEAESSMGALQKNLSFEVEEKTLENALQEIAERGGFGLSYSPNVVPEQKAVPAHIEGTVSDVLRNLFSGTDLEVLISPRKEIIISQHGRASALTGSKTGLPEGLIEARAVSVAGPGNSLAVRQTVSGRVADAQTGNPVPGASVFVPETTTGTATNVDGEYSLEVPDEADSLRYSAIGYLDRTVAINGRTTIDVQLKRDVQALEEIVVVGYGTQRQAEITGSVSSIESADISDLSVSSFQDAIQGKLAGIEISQPSGAPGAAPRVRVRGTSSITAGNGPLYVIDGLPLSGGTALQGGIIRRDSDQQPPAQNPLSAIAPNDIESIEVLKDASASAIYGSRGANGVVLISTKSGSQESDVRVNYSASLGMQEVINEPDMMNADELVQLTIESRNNAYEEEVGSPPPNPRTNEGRPEPGSFGGLAPFIRIPERYVQYDQGNISTNTDWLDLTLGDAAGTWRSNLSVSGGGDDISYYLSGSVQQQDGIVGGSAFNRYSFHTSVEANPLERVRVGTDVNLSLSQQDRAPANGPYFARPPGIVYSAMVHSPLVEPFNEDGEPNQREGDPVSQSFLTGGTTSASNPLAIQQAVDEDLDHHRTFGTAFAEVDVLENITLKTLFGADLSDYTRNFFRDRSLLYRTNTTPEPYGQSSSARSFNWLSENTIQYKNTFSEVHSFDVLAGFTAQEERQDFSQTFAQNFPINSVPTLSGGQVTDGTSESTEWSLLSGLGRVNYDYNSKYLVTAAIRADKSSRFGPGNRTGIFPSASVGWRVSEERFMDAVPEVSSLKLRLSYGQTGNFQIPNYGAFGNLRFESYVDAGQNVITGVEPQDLGDPTLTWETTEEVNVGLNIGLFDERVSLVADAYQSTTSDLLLNVSVPSASGYETVLTNIGEVENTGLELFLETQNLTGEFSWSSSINFSTNRNEVTALGPGDAPIRSAGVAGIRHITQVGEPIGSYYGYKIEGVYQSEEEIQNAPVDRVGDPSPGDLRFKDVNGDGEITPDDKTVTGSYQPDFTYGITNTFRYQGFDLRIFLQGVEGRDILNLTNRHMGNGEFNFNQYSVFLNRWQSAGDPGNGEIPRPDRLTGLHGNNNRISEFQVQDGSYLNVREVTLGYTFQGGTFDNLVRQARVYASAQNLNMFTDYRGFNPMASIPTKNQLTIGQDYGAYPLQRTWTVGLDIAF
jgi:TonB-linked SusC/RagA family outer membrane protein